MGTTPQPQPSNSPSQPLKKIVYPSNLINGNSRYGNQFMALYINTDTNPGTTFSGANNQPQIKDPNGNAVQIAPGHSGSIINNFTAAAAGGNLIRSTSQGSTTLYAIYLPIPMNLAADFGITYDEFEFGTEAAKLAQSVIGKGLQEFNKTVSITGVKALLGGAQELLNSGLALNAAGAYNTIAINPHKQLLFKGVGLRKPKFTYKLIARNKDERDTIDYIIRLLRFYMHPDLDGAFLYKYPSEFDMEFYILNNGVAQHNPYLPFFTTSVLQNLSVNYTGGKEFSSHSDGAPVEYELSLEFQETQVLNKSVINAYDTYVNNGGLQIQEPPGPLSGAAQAIQNLLS